MGDNHELANSEHFTLIDPNQNDDHDRNSSGIFNRYNVNGRIIVILISLILLVLSFTLFIGSVVVYNSRSDSPRTEECGTLATTPTQRSQTTPDFSSVTTNGPVPTPSPTKQIVTTTVASTSTTETLVKEPSISVVNGNHPDPGVIVFEDTFDTFNLSTWSHITSDSGSDFFSYVNARNNSFIKNGILHLKPTFIVNAQGYDSIVKNGVIDWNATSNTGGKVRPILTAMITTNQSLAFTYGRLEIRAKMPGGDWLEPIISLQPKENAYGKVSNGQIHLIDIKGNRQLFQDSNGAINVGSERNCPDIRYGIQDQMKAFTDCLFTDRNRGFDTEFRNYTLEWDMDELSISIDKEKLVSVPYPRSSTFQLWSKGRKINNPWKTARNPKIAPFDRNFYLVLGVMVGGMHDEVFSDDNHGPYPKPWNNYEEEPGRSFWEHRNDWESSWSGDAPSLQIDYIRLYSSKKSLVEA